MPKYYELILHSKEGADSFKSEADESYAQLKVPEVGRHSTMDALVLRQVQLFWSRESQLGRVPEFKDHSEALLYLQRVTAAYRAWNQFKAEYAEVVALSLQGEEASRATSSSVDVKTSQSIEISRIFKRMQDDGIFLNTLTASGESFIIKSLINDREKLKKELTDKSGKETFKEMLFSKDERLNDIYKAYFAYFERLGVSNENNKASPEDYLMRNFNESLDRDSLLYVRACEELGCSLNPQGTDFAKMIVDNVGNQLVKNMNKSFKNKEKTLFYGGFASGLLLRDLVILKQLIESGCKSFELAFVDQGYEKLIKQVGDASPVSLAEQISIDMQMKTINEFANWMATHVECGKETPLKIHFFSKVTDAEAYFTKETRKMDVLVAQDYFTQEGAPGPRAATPTAHRDFMQLTRVALNDQACFYELIKDDLKREVYLHVGIANAGARYSPFFTNVHELENPVTKTYPFTSLSFFTDDKEGAESCARGALCTTHPFVPGKKS